MRSFVTVLLITLFAAPIGRAQSVEQTIDADALRANYVERIQRHLDRLPHLRAAVDVLIQHTEQGWVNGEWVNERQVRYQYEGDNTTQVLTLQWDGDEWQNLTRWSYTYDGNLVTMQLYEEWDGDGWVPTHRYTYTYSGNVPVEILFEMYENGAWVNDSRTTYQTSGGTIQAWETEDWDGSQWILADRSEVTEDDGNVIFTYQERQGGAWVNVDRTTFLDVTLDELFDMLNEAQLQLDVALGFGFGFTLPEYIDEIWTGSDWENEYRQLISYDNSGNPVMITNESWENGAWVGDMRQVRTFDSGQLTELILQTIEEGEWVDSFVETYTYDGSLLVEILQQVDVGTGLMNVSLFTLEWTTTGTDAEDNELPSAISLAPVYPNPFNPSAIVSYELSAPGHASVRVYDVLGRQVSTLAEGPHAAGSYDVTFDAAALPSGVYVIRLQAGQDVRTRMVSLAR